MAHCLLKATDGLSAEELSCEVKEDLFSVNKL